jgi:hypothetical protein
VYEGVLGVLTPEKSGEGKLLWRVFKVKGKGPLFMPIHVHTDVLEHRILKMY